MNEKDITELERINFQGFMESKDLPIHAVTRRTSKPHLSSLKKQREQ